MVGTTLVDIREHVESLASEDGEYYLVCSRTGERPVPAADLTFDDRSTARAAARATEQYRAALRRYDPKLPYHDLIVTERRDPSESHEVIPSESDESSDRAPSKRSDSTVATTTAARRERVEFCHAVAAAVFETLTDNGYDSVEDAVMDAYVDLAETLVDPDDLCLCLLESMAGALDETLDPSDQAAVLAEAADRLGPVEGSRQPVSESFDALEELGLLDGTRRSPIPVDLEGETPSVSMEVAEYALSPRDGRLPVLPLVVELYRRGLDRSLSAITVSAVEEHWRVTVEFADTVEPTAVVSAPIEAGG